MSSGHDDSSSSNKHFTFTIENGAVTAYFEVENGITQQESLDNRDSFVIDGTQITHTKQTSNGPEVTIYSDPESDGSYKVISDSTDDDSVNDDRPGSGDRKGYQFTINDNNEVVEVFEIKKGVPELKPIDDDGTETYAVNENGEVVRTDDEPEIGTEITVYADADGDGTYFRVSEQWALDSPEDGPFRFEGRLVYSPTDDDDHVGVRGGEDCHGGQGADDFVIREAAHLRIGDFNSSEDNFIIFDTGLGLTSIEQLASFVTDAQHDGQDFIVYFGDDVSITLVGVQPDQISWDDVSVLS